MSTDTADQTTVDTYIQFLRNWYHDELATLAQNYPQDQQSLQIDHADLFSFDPDIADDMLAQPDQIKEYLENAVYDFDLPADIDLSDAHVRVHNLPDEHTYYPDEFSPTKHHGQYRAIQGEISKATDIYARMHEAAFECQRCGKLTRIPQVDGDFQEPHECMGCERQGPFEINFTQSDFVDGQKIRIKTPPEHAQGDGKDIDGFIKDDLCRTAGVGDRVTVCGQVQLEQDGGDRNKKNKFSPYLEIHHIEVEQTDAEDVDISQADRERIKQLANGAEGDPLELAAKTLAPKVYGYKTSKKAIVLALVGGSRTEYSGGDFDRGEFHVLLIGDPSTAKSKIVNRAEQLGWRSVGVSGKGATVAGVTATATQDEFGGGEWTLESGAFVKANKGVVCADELDDMPKDVRAAMLEPMSKQYINVNKGGINTTLETRTGVIAAANPEHGRFDPYEPISQQFVFGSTLLSRFDLVYTFKDEPDESEDSDVADHVLNSRDGAKRDERGLETEDDLAVVDPPIEPELLQHWIALSKRQPKPVFASPKVKEQIKDSFTTLRGMHGYDPDEPVPVTFRTLEGIVRVAEAAAKFEFSDEIRMRHVEIATNLVGESMQDIGKDEDGKMDADTVETGESKSQRERMKALVGTIQEIQQETESGHAPIQEIKNRAGYDATTVESDLASLSKKGEIYEPQTDAIRYVG